MILRYTRASVVFLAALLLVTGCSSATGDQSVSYSKNDVQDLSRQEAKSGHPEQAAALKDGTVSETEYKAAIKQVSKCITDAGYAVTPPVLSPVTNSTFEFAYDSSGRNQDKAFKDYDKCEAKYWLPVSTVYGATAPQHMDEPLLNAVEKCMKDAGTPVSGSPSTYKELAGSRGEQSTNASDCTTDLAYKLYPDLRTLSLEN